MVMRYQSIIFLFMQTNTHAPHGSLRAVALSVCVSLFLIVAFWAASGTAAHAAVAQWQNGFHVVSRSPDDIGNDSFKQSMRNMRADGVNAVSFVVPYYQSNIFSTDVNPGFNTPTDAALASAIDYAHSLGFTVTLTAHNESYDGNWRALINPGDRDGWFNAYGNTLVHLAQIAQAHHAEMIIIGAELEAMTSDNRNPTNTQHWIDIIGRMRAAYSGKLTYSALADEKLHIGFWPQLDYVGLSVYYNNPNTPDNSVGALMGLWDHWNNIDIGPFARTVGGKPILITEIGYRSISGAHQDPWNWSRGGAEDQTEQANDYQALMQYWNGFDFIKGIYWWNWSTDPNAGGAGDLSYTPQGKQAEQILKNWLINPNPPPPGGTPSFTLTASANPTQVSMGSQTTITASVTDKVSALSNGVVDIEAYDQNHVKVFQQFYSGQNIGVGEARTYNAAWTLTAAGTYTVAVGVFNANWSTAYAWNNSAMNITVGGTVPPPSGSRLTEIWWPSNGASVSGLQTFKAMVQNIALPQYQTWWQVDGDRLNPMYDSAQDYPHKEAMVDLSGWKWKGNGPYTITFVSKDLGGDLISQKSVNINVF